MIIWFPDLVESSQCDVMAIFPVLDQECPFSENLFQKENIVTLR